MNKALQKPFKIDIVLGEYSKRGLIRYIFSTYNSVSLEYLLRYIDEAVYYRHFRKAEEEEKQNRHKLEICAENGSVLLESLSREIIVIP